MKATEIVSLVTAIVGAMLGTAGFVISVLAFLRDRPRLKVCLQWDMAEIGNPTNKIGVVRVANIGRRAVYISAVALELPKGSEHTHLVLNDSLRGNRLEEGGAEATFPVKYDGLSKYKAKWNRIRAMAEDTAGKKYYSAYPDKKPSWA